MTRYLALVPVTYDGSRPYMAQAAQTPTGGALCEMAEGLERIVSFFFGKRPADDLGGADGDWEEYTGRDSANRPGHDKGGHRERSQANDRRRGKSHREHWKKQERRGH